MKDVSRALLLAPAVFVLHFVEESPGFVQWFNSHVARGITPGLFWTVNLTALVITVAVVLFEWFSRTPLSLGVALGWLSFLMAANAVFHVAGALVDRRYVPGLFTAILLYAPYYVWLFMKALKTRRLTAAALLAAAVPCSLPMLIHGYLILLRGDRLF
ncbi:MAG: HXXEE domain-containing protein [Acidobacteria bacterium]|nr:HXXEE domain-containing protein [Acidobacteriota bacterium]